LTDSGFRGVLLFLEPQPSGQAVGSSAGSGAGVPLTLAMISLTLSVSDLRFLAIHHLFFCQSTICCMASLVLRVFLRNQWSGGGFLIILGRSPYFSLFNISLSADSSSSKGTDLIQIYLDLFHCSQDSSRRNSRPSATYGRNHHTGPFTTPPLGFWLPPILHDLVKICFDLCLCLGIFLAQLPNILKLFVKRFTLYHLILPPVAFFHETPWGTGVSTLVGGGLTYTGRGGRA